MEDFFAVRYIPEKQVVLAVAPLLTGTARLTLSSYAEWPDTYTDGW